MSWESLRWELLSWFFIMGISIGLGAIVSEFLRKKLTMKRSLRIAIIIPLAIIAIYTFLYAFIYTITEEHLTTEQWYEIEMKDKAMIGRS